LLLFLHEALEDREWESTKWIVQAFATQRVPKQALVGVVEPKEVLVSPREWSWDGVRSK